MSPLGVAVSIRPWAPWNTWDVVVNFSLSLIPWESYRWSLAVSGCPHSFDFGQGQHNSRMLS